MFLNAPDKYFAGAMLSIKKLCNGAGDRKSIYDMILSMSAAELATIPDLAAKLSFIATSEAYGNLIFSDTKF